MSNRKFLHSPAGPYLTGEGNETGSEFIIKIVGESFSKVIHKVLFNHHGSFFKKSMFLDWRQVPFCFRNQLDIVLMNGTEFFYYNFVERRFLTINIDLRNEKIASWDVCVTSVQGKLTAYICVLTLNGFIFYCNLPDNTNVSICRRSKLCDSISCALFSPVVQESIVFAFSVGNKTSHIHVASIGPELEPVILENNSDAIKFKESFILFQMNSSLCLVNWGKCEFDVYSIDLLTKEVTPFISLKFPVEITRAYVTDGSKLCALSVDGSLFNINLEEKSSEKFQTSRSFESDKILDLKNVDGCCLVLLETGMTFAFLENRTLCLGKLRLQDEFLNSFDITHPFSPEIFFDKAQSILSRILGSSCNLSPLNNWTDVRRLWDYICSNFQSSVAKTAIYLLSTVLEPLRTSSVRMRLQIPNYMAEQIDHLLQHNGESTKDIYFEEAHLGLPTLETPVPLNRKSALELKLSGTKELSKPSPQRNRLQSTFTAEAPADPIPSSPRRSKRLHPELSTDPSEDLEDLPPNITVRPRV